MRPLMPPVQTPDNLFHDGNPLTGELGTIVDAEHLNNEQAAIRDTQSELIAILTAAAMEPESTAGQLLAALNKLYAPLNDTLGALSSLVGGANKLPYFTSANAAALTALSGIGRDIVGKATVADVLTYLGLGDVAKAGVAGGLLASDGYITLPLIIGGVKTNVILQWVTGPTAGAETVNYPNVTFPVTFPNACLFA
ncbi:gp53-like domain-containing protein, partial [Enterobacter roggenkampii]